MSALLMLPSNPLDNLPGRDSGVFLYGGQQILLGKTPYVDFWDHKGPLIHYLNALGLFLGGGSRWGVWVLELFILSITGWGIFQVAARQWGRFPGLFSLLTWACMVYLGGSYFHFHDSNYTETFSLLFNVLGVCLWVKTFTFQDKSKNFFFVGVMAGCSFLLRPNNIGAQIAIFVVELVDALSSGEFRKRLYLLGSMMLGGISVLALVLLYFYQRNALLQFFDSVVSYNLAYKDSGISSIFEILLFGFSKFDWVPLVGYVFVLFYSSRYFLLKKDIDSGRLFVKFLLFGFPIEAVLTSLSGRILLHYYIIWIPYISWMVGFLIYDVSKLFFKKIDDSFFAIFSSLIFVAIVFSNIAAEKKYFNIINRVLFDNRGEMEKKVQVVEYLKGQTAKGDYVLVWGNEVWINYYLKLSAPTKYAYQYPLFMAGYTDEEKVHAFLLDLETQRPKFIVEPIVDTDEIMPLSAERRASLSVSIFVPPGMDKVFEFVDRNYCVKEDVHDITIYQLISDSNPASPCK
jgi:hypothetical protein